MRVHIILKDAVCRNPEALAAFRKELSDLTDIQDVNDGRLQRHGVLTGTIEDDRLPLIRALDQVEAANPDEARSIA